MATINPATSELLTSGWITVGSAPKYAGEMSTASATVSERPMTKVRRTSSKRDAMICRPLTMMNAATNINIALAKAAPAPAFTKPRGWVLKPSLKSRRRCAGVSCARLPSARAA